MQTFIKAKLVSHFISNTCVSVTFARKRVFVLRITANVVILYVFSKKESQGEEINSYWVAGTHQLSF